MPHGACGAGTSSPATPPRQPPSPRGPNLPLDRSIASLLAWILSVERCRNLRKSRNRNLQLDTRDSVSSEGAIPPNRTPFVRRTPRRKTKGSPAEDPHGADWTFTTRFNPGSLRPALDGLAPSFTATRCPLAVLGADGGGRTHTPLRVPDFESSASADSATSASWTAPPALPASRPRGIFSRVFHGNRGHPTQPAAHAAHPIPDRQPWPCA